MSLKEQVREFIGNKFINRSKPELKLPPNRKQPVYQQLPEGTYHMLEEALPQLDMTKLGSNEIFVDGAVFLSPEPVCDISQGSCIELAVMNASADCWELRAAHISHRDEVIFSIATRVNLEVYRREGHFKRATEKLDNPDVLVLLERFRARVNTESL